MQEMLGGSMSLAADILKRAERLSPLIKPTTEMFGPQLPPGVYISKDKRQSRPTVKFRAFSHKPEFTLMGEFRTASRAHIAVRLYNLWLSRGFCDVPNKPSFRLYGNR